MLYPLRQGRPVCGSCSVSEPPVDSPRRSPRVDTDKGRYIPLQCDEKALPVHEVMCPPEVQEYQEDGVLVYADELLGEL